MKANELRIGNWFYQDMIGGGYSQITPERILDLYYDPLDDYYKPIPLTEEILLKIKSVEKDYDVLEDCTMFIFGEVGEYKLIIILHDGKFLYEWQTEIDYLHELQNLFYAINKTEFEINL